MESAIQVLIAVDMYRLEELKTHALVYIAKHSELVTETDGFKQLVEKSLDHAHLINEMFASLEMYKRTNGSAAIPPKSTTTDMLANAGLSSMEDNVKNKRVSA